MSFKIALGAAAAALSVPTAAAVPAAPPKLVIAVSVDQLSADLFDSYRPYFTGGMARIASGTAYRNGFQSHAATETCPGHSTLLTASHPSQNGIIANLWINQSIARADKAVYCAEDESVPGSSSIAYTVSAKHLKAKTLGDLMKTLSPASRNVAVAGKDRAAVMMGGHAPDQRWYWDGTTFSTDLAAARVPASVTAFKATLAKAMAQPRAAMEPPAFCAGKDKTYALTPALTVGNGRFARAAGDPRAFRVSPDLDGAVLALSAALINEMGLGKGPATDIISVGLSATDYVGHAFGTGGMEMCLQMAALDLQLGGFLDALDRNGLDYAVVLTADHGGLDIPERLKDQGIADAARVDPALAASEVGKRIAGMLGLGQQQAILGSGVSGDFWINEKLGPADRKRVLNLALKTYRAHPQVYAAYSKAEVAATAMPSGDPRGWSVLQRLRASFDPQRSGDFLVVLKPHVMPIPVPSAGYASTHGSPWDYDRRVPILFWRKGMAPRPREEWADTIDILPTVAAMIGLRLPADSSGGRCLFVDGVPCPR